MRVKRLTALVALLLIAGCASTAPDHRVRVVVFNTVADTGRISVDIDGEPAYFGWLAPMDKMSPQIAAMVTRRLRTGVHRIEVHFHGEVTSGEFYILEDSNVHVWLRPGGVELQLEKGDVIYL